MPRCGNWSQNCHILDNKTSKRCGDAKGVECPNLDGWQHYPDSPYGDVDICPHGCIREHGKTEHFCRFCDEEVRNL